MRRNSITADTKVQRAQNLLSSGVAEETILLSMQQNQFYGMNRVGSRIWELLSTPIKVDDLCEVLQSEFDVPASECLADLMAFLESMQADGLVEIQSP